MSINTPQSTYGQVIHQSAQRINQGAGEAELLALDILPGMLPANSSLEFYIYVTDIDGNGIFKLYLNDTLIREYDLTSDGANGVINFARYNDNKLVILKAPGAGQLFGGGIYNNVTPLVDFDYGDKNQLRIVGAQIRIEAYRLITYGNVVEIPQPVREFEPPPEPPPVTESVTFAEDYEQGSQPDDWSQHWGTEGGDVFYTVGATALQAWNDHFRGVRSTLTWNDKNYKNNISVTTFEVQSAGGFGILCGIASRISGATGSESCYTAVVRDGGELHLYRYAGGSSSLLNSANVGFLRDTVYKLKLEIETNDSGNVSLKTKIWESDNEEPEAWTIEEIDDSGSKLENGDNGIFQFSFQDTDSPHLFYDYEILDLGNGDE